MISGAIFVRSGLVIGALFLAGCAATPVRYTNSQSVSEAQFMRDRFDCAQRASGRNVSSSGNAVTGWASASMTSRTEIDDNLFLACLASRGYIRNPDGPLIVSGQALVKTSRFVNR